VGEERFRKMGRVGVKKLGERRSEEMAGEGKGRGLV
jgi:hypothetical protein